MPSPLSSLTVERAVCSCLHLDEPSLSVADVVVELGEGEEAGGGCGSSVVRCGCCSSGDNIGGR